MAEEGNREQLAEALLEVLAAPRDAAQDQSHAAEALAARRRGRLVTCAIAGWCVLGALWILRPAQVFSPTEALAAAPVLDEAGLRYAMFLQAGRIEEFVEAHHRLPSSLGEAGEVEEGLQWQRLGSAGWVLVGAEAGRTLRLTDQMSVDSFLGKSLATIRRR